MEFFLDYKILASIVVLIFAGLAIFFAYTIKKLFSVIEVTASDLRTLFGNMSSTMNSMSKDLNDIKTKLVVTLDEVDSLTSQVKTLSTNIDNNIERVFNIITPVEKIVALIADKVYPSVSQIANLISASSKAVNTFLNVLGRNRNKD